MKIQIIVAGLEGNTCSFHINSPPKSFLIFKTEGRLLAIFVRKINANQLLYLLTSQTPNICGGRELSFENVHIFELENSLELKVCLSPGLRYNPCFSL